MSTLPPLRANAGIEAAMRLRLDKAICAMHNSVVHWLAAAYKQNTPAMAQDAVASVALRGVMRALAKRWLKRFEDLAPEMAAHFAKSINDRTDGALTNMLKKHGMAVNFTMSKEMRDVMQASVGEQVALIKSIPQKYFTDIEVAVMQSAAQGRDLQSLLQTIGDKVDLARIGRGVRAGESSKSYIARTRRRAELIARDQNNKMTANFTRVRQQSIGIVEAVWMHSSAGKEPRPEHLKWGRDKKRYKVSEGMWSEKEGKYVFPGSEINCRCTSRAIIPGTEHRYA